jgi:hypothetical protein
MPNAKTLFSIISFHTNYLMDLAFYWAFAIGSQWYPLADSVQIQIENMMIIGEPLPVILPFFPEPLYTDYALSHLIYLDGHGNSISFPLGRVFVRVTRNE